MRQTYNEVGTRDTRETDTRDIHNSRDRTRGDKHMRLTQDRHNETGGHTNRETECEMRDGHRHS